MRTGSEVAVFVVRRDGAEVLILHRSPEQGAYWHVVAGGVEPGEATLAAARRELQEETGLVAPVTAGPQVVEYAYPLTEEPADRRDQHDPSVVAVAVSCFRCAAPDDWEPILDWEHDDHRWCSVSEAAKTLRWPATASALQQMLSVAHASTRASLSRLLGSEAAPAVRPHRDP
jgi:8-oxo-dGTP pyrophosphatase MutT (NUDIX family)